MATPLKKNPCSFLRIPQFLMLKKAKFFISSLALKKFVTTGCSHQRFCTSTSYSRMFYYYSINVLGAKNDAMYPPLSLSRKYIRYRRCTTHPIRRNVSVQKYLGTAKSRPEQKERERDRERERKKGRGRAEKRAREERSIEILPALTRLPRRENNCRAAERA